MGLSDFRLLGIAALLFSTAPANAQRADKFSDMHKAFVTADQPVILVRNARLLDGLHWKPREQQDMLVRDGRIAEIGRGLKAPSGAKIIEAGGRTLMPGMVMVHEHLMALVPLGKRFVVHTNPYVAQVMLAYGTTTARTAGGLDLEGDLRLKRQIDDGVAAGPDLDVTIFIGGPKDTLLTIDKLADAEAARREVAYWAGHGATSIKLFFHTTPDVARGAIAEAKAQRMGIAGHLCATKVATAAGLGLETLEHGLWAAYDLVPSANEESCPIFERQVAMFKQTASLDANGPEVGKILEMLLAHKIAITPTMATLDGTLCSPITLPPIRERSLLKRPDKIEPQSPCFEGIDAAIEKRSHAFQNATAVRYHRMGGTLLVGTDAWLVPGAGGPRELEILVEAGLRPIDALKAATIDGARAVHRADDIGTLEVGKRADFLLIDGSPDVNISDIRKLVAVYKNGIGYDPQKLYEDAKGQIIN
jgi:imidazolonepropionase-like amidohydrolase